MAKDIIRRCRFTPPSSPTFSLTVWHTHRYMSLMDSRTILGYRLTVRDDDGSKVLFEGEDFAGSPMHADDSDATIKSLMSFLTLRPGDTDADYFAGYNDAQRGFCEFHAEALSAEVMHRFGE